MNRCEFQSFSNERDPSERGPIRQANFRGRGYPGALGGSRTSTSTGGGGFLRDPGGRGPGGGGRSFFGWGPSPKKPPKRVPNQRSLLPLGPLPKPLRPLWRILKKHPWFRLLDLIEPFIERPPQEGGYDMPGNGFSIYCDNGLGPHARFKTSSFNPGLVCGTAGQVPDGSFGTDIYRDGNNIRWVAFGRFTPIGTTGRMALDQQWSRAPSPDPIPWRDPLPVGLTPPKLLPPPWLEPLFPHPNPPPVPWPLVPYRPKPLPDLHDQTHHGNGPPNSDGRQQPPPDPWTPPREPPRPRPPPPRVKEKKVYGPVKRGIMEAWDAATEVEDTLECFLGTVDKNKLRRAKLAHKGNTSKLRLMWMLWDDIDAAKALDCILENHYQDKVVGGLHRILKAKGLGIGFGGTPYRRTSATDKLKQRKWK